MKTAWPGARIKATGEDEVTLSDSKHNNPRFLSRATPLSLNKVGLTDQGRITACQLPIQQCPWTHTTNAWPILLNM